MVQNAKTSEEPSNTKEKFFHLFHFAGKDDDIQRINNLFLPLFAAAFLAAVCVGWKANAVGPVLLWVFASLTAGGTAGFLFGIPKSSITQRTNATSSPAPSPTDLSADNVDTSSGDKPQRARPNTNLEEVSDWLTKILVGLTLVNLKDLKNEVWRISLNAAASLSDHPTDSQISAATALIVGFALIGFLSVYLYMRLFIQGAIIRSDDQLNQYRNAVERAVQIGKAEPAASPAVEAGVAVVPSAASLNAAQEVAKVAPHDQPELILRPLKQLANQYEALRQLKDYSVDRTQQMAEIVHRMRPHAIAAAPYIREMIESTSPGEHLAATVILQMKYMQEHMRWLARRLVEERAFIGYQAASALLARARVAGVPECKEIQEAVAEAKTERAKLGIKEGSLDNLIDQILNVK